MNSKNRRNQLLFFLLIVNKAFSQELSEPMHQNFIESITEFTSETTDYDELITQKAGLYKNKLNINTATAIELNSIDIMSQLQINHLIEHIHSYGDLTSIYELQTIESFNLELIHVLIDWVKINEKSWDDLRSKDPMHHRIRMGFAHRPEKSIGYSRLDSNKFLGSALKMIMRFNGNKGDVLSYGFQCEKDAGEMFKVLFYSGYVLFKTKGKIEQIVLGDQQVTFGQGLMLGSGLALGKSSLIVKILKTNFGAKPYASLNETGFIRGISSHVNINNKLRLCFYVGRRTEDAFLVKDSLNNVSGNIISTGNYRNKKELSTKHNIKSIIYGMHLQFHTKMVEINVGLVKTKKNIPLRTDYIKPYNAFKFNALQQIKSSMDWKWQHKNSLSFGELVFSKSQKPSFISGLLIAAGKKVDLCILYRYYSIQYDGNTSNAFGEFASNQNEKGLYTGIRLQLPYHLNLNIYFDLVKSMWLKYRINAPSNMNDLFCEMIYKPKKTIAFTIRYRQLNKQYNESASKPLKMLESHLKHALRCHLEYSINKFRIRSRFEQILYKIENKSITNGMLLYQDIQFKLTQKIKLSARYTIFETDDFNNRIFVYENNIPGYYNMNTFSGIGNKYYLYLQIQISKHLQIWFKFARSVYEDKEKLGSGQDEINSNHISDINFQMQWKI